MSLYVVIAAVVVGQDETLRRNDFAGATAAENDHGIFQRHRVGVVNVLGADFEAETFHLFDVLPFEQREEPHAFIGMSREEG